MPTVFCPSCGAEYLTGVTTCADCGASLAGHDRPDDPVEVGPLVDDVDDDVDEIVYELGDWSGDQRRKLGQLLTGAGVVHRWEVGSDLVILDGDEDAVEALIDEVEFPDALPPLPESEEDGDDEATYAVMSDLFVAADRLQRDPDDVALAGEFYKAADSVSVTPAPFGIDAPVWQQVQELAAGVCSALEADADDEVITRDAGSLRQLLSRYV